VHVFHVNLVINRGKFLTKMYRLHGRKSKLSTSNKLLLYKAILKPVWTYGTQLWGPASNFNTEILERFRSKALRMTVDTPRYVIRRALQTSHLKKKSAATARLSAHPNGLVVNLMGRRLRRHLPNNLPTSFLVQLSYLWL
jgi:hypothetical protein